jgi:hypothetical protein
MKTNMSENCSELDDFIDSGISLGNDYNIYIGENEDEEDY